MFPCPFFIAFSSDVIAQVRKRVKLEGKELEDFLEKDKVKKEAAKKLEQAKEYVSANKQCFSYPKTAVYSHIHAHCHHRPEGQSVTKIWRGALT